MALFSASVSALKIRPPLPAGADELVEEERPDPVVLVLVGHHERDLRLGAAGCAVEATDCDEAVADRRHERQAIDVVNGREASHLGVGQRRVEREEAHVHRVGRQLAVEGHERAASSGRMGRTW